VERGSKQAVARIHGVVSGRAVSRAGPWREGSSAERLRAQRADHRVFSDVPERACDHLDRGTRREDEEDGPRSTYKSPHLSGPPRSAPPAARWLRRRPPHQESAGSSRH
jgi:hypothetical protein